MLLRKAPTVTAPLSTTSAQGWTSTAESATASGVNPRSPATAGRRPARPEPPMGRPARRAERGRERCGGRGHPPLARHGEQMLVHARAPDGQPAVGERLLDDYAEP